MSHKKQTRFDSNKLRVIILNITFLLSLSFILLAFELGNSTENKAINLVKEINNQVKGLQKASVIEYEEDILLTVEMDFE